MIRIGEKLNSSIPTTQNMFEKRDRDAVVALIEKQEEAGADYLDINTALCADKELETMLWVIGLAMEHSGCGIMIDSPSTAVMKEAMAACKGRKLIVNSVTITDRMEEIAPLIAESGAGVVGMPVGGDGDRASLDGRMHNISLLVEKLRSFGIKDEQIYVDIMMEAAAFDSESPALALRVIGELKNRFPAVKSVCGLSNVSFGLPGRVNINIAALSAGVFLGLDSAILDVTSPKTRLALLSADVVAGNDEYCMEYISYLREQEE